MRAWISRVERVETWIFAPVDIRQIAAMRIGFSAILLFRLFRYDFTALSSQPQGLYRPLSYMHAFNAMPSERVVSALQVIAVVTAVFAMIGYRSRSMLPVATACALVLFGMTSSLGKVMHNEALLMLCLVPIAFGTTDEVWSLNSWRQRKTGRQRKTARMQRVGGDSSVLISGWPWRVALLLVCGAYFFSGFAKLTHSGLAWLATDNLRWILYANSDGRAVPDQWSLLIADHRWLARIMGTGIFLLELTFPVVLWKPVLRWLFVPAVVAMHGSTYLTLHLDYSAMAAVVVVTTVSWPAITQLGSKLKLQGSFSKLKPAGQVFPS